MCELCEAYTNTFAVFLLIVLSFGVAGICSLPILEWVKEFRSKKESKKDTPDK